MESDPDKHNKSKEDENPDNQRTTQADQKPEPDGVRPLGKKIPEPPGNLRQRSEWFRKRSD